MIFNLKGCKGMGMEGFIARQYDKSAKRDMADLYRTWAKKLSEELAEGDHVLEVAPGPGYLSIELAKLRKLQITGLDISETFVAIARKNAQIAGVDVDFQHGNASAMPFENKKFDFLMCYTFKHTLRPRALTAGQFKELVTQTPFSKFEITENSMDLEVLLAK